MCKFRNKSVSINHFNNIKLQNYSMLKICIVLSTLFVMVGLSLLLQTSYADQMNSQGIGPPGWAEKYLTSSFNKQHAKSYDIETICNEEDYRTIIYLNHTIKNGVMKGICSEDYNLYFEIESFDDGFLIIDIPTEVFDAKEDTFSETFGAHVYSHKYKTYDYEPYLFRISVPASFEESIEYDENDTLESQQDKKRIFENWRDSNLEQFTIPETEHLTITKIKSFDSFDRFKVPFLKDDYLFNFDYLFVKMFLDESSHSPPVPYNVSNYTVPTQKIVDPIKLENDFTVNSDTDYTCSSNLIPISKPDNSKNACVKLTSAEKLISRGWIDLR